MRKKDDDKRFYDLWWQFLKLSDPYKVFCDVLFEYPDPDQAFLNKMSILPFVPDLLPSSPEEMILNEMLLWMNYKKFGDVFRTKFDEWWTANNLRTLNEPVVEDLEETIEREACKFVAHCALGFKTQITDDTIIDLLRRYIKFYNQQHKYIKVRLSANNLETRNAVSNLISEHKKKHSHSLALIESYLTTYKLFREGHDKDAVKKKVLGAQALKELTKKQADDKIRLYQGNAIAIIQNVEKGDFPGDY